MELGSEDNNTTDRKTYARLTTALPLSDHESLTNFRVKLTVPLLFVDFVPKATPELLYNVQVAPVVGALYTPKTTVMALRCFSIEATGITIDLAPTLRAAVIYPGTGSLTLLASPLSEIAYRLASVTGDLAKNISAKNTAVTLTISDPVLRPSISPSAMSVTKASIVTVGLGSFEFSPICDTTANAIANLPASSLATLVVLMLVGMVLVILTPVILKAVATAERVPIMLLG
jgi:hypothetical protein